MAVSIIKIFYKMMYEPRNKLINRCMDITKLDRIKKNGNKDLDTHGTLGKNALRKNE